MSDATQAAVPAAIKSAISMFPPGRGSKLSLETPPFNATCAACVCTIRHIETPARRRPQRCAQACTAGSATMLGVQEKPAGVETGGSVAEANAVAV
jgi:hypothetical protein